MTYGAKKGTLVTVSTRNSSAETEFGLIIELSHFKYPVHSLDLKRDTVGYQENRGNWSLQRKLSAVLKKSFPVV